MTATRRSAEDDSPRPAQVTVRDDAAGPKETAVAPALVTGSSSDRCAVCGAGLGADQRYCVECGNRRGAPRFTLAKPVTSNIAGDAAAPASRGSLPAALLVCAALLIVLLSLGIGVLIGHGTVDKQLIRVYAPSVGSAGTVHGSSGSTTAKGSKGSKTSTPGTGSGATKQSSPTFFKNS